MKMNTAALNDKGFRFPSEIISYAVWLYFRFSLSFRYGRRTPGSTWDHRDLGNGAAVVPQIRTNLRQ